MAVTIDNVDYDETTLTPEVKNSILQVQASTAAIQKLQAEILNHQILIAHHSKNIKDGLPTDEEPTEAADVGEDA
jgi:hypothetical protein|tara:strand:- start:282 stop:506 length:225 start_codon:yes stop_codon:yes gene_type:complete